MALAEQHNEVAQARERAVAAHVGRIRNLERDGGVTRETLAAIRAELNALAADLSLFPPEDFPLGPDGENMIYRLSEDEGGRFALYVSTGRTGKETPPHDHTTWAVIVGVRGKEHNRLYRRTDDGAIPGRGEVEVVQEITVQHGTGVCLMPEDIHSIHLEGDPPTLHLHMYGLGIDKLDRRVAYNREEGTYRHFPASNNISDRWA